MIGPVPLASSLLLVFLSPVAASPPREPRPETAIREPTLLLGAAYPIEVRASLPAALLHWLDSLAGLSGHGLTAGKTVPAHRLEYVDLLGQLTPEARTQLERFASARTSYARQHADPHALTACFFDAHDLDTALARAETLLGAEEGARLGEAVSYFAPAYRKIWRDGAIPQDFIDRAATSARRRALAGFLVDLARFYGVSPVGKPMPVLVLAPVRDGFGTHAQAIERWLLVEIRQGEGLIDEVAPIVHENAHFLQGRMKRSRFESFENAAAGIGETGRRAWFHLQEALPTALAQGLAEQRFRPGSWSLRAPWYDVEAVDAYAKRIFPLVRKRVEAGGRFDEEFLRALIEAFPP